MPAYPLASLGSLFARKRKHQCHNHANVLVGRERMAAPEKGTTMDMLGLALIGMVGGIVDNPFFFVLGACIVVITACIAARLCSFTINIGWVILGVLGLVALALLAFAPAFSLSVALLVFAYRIGMTKLVPWLREVRQPRPVDDEWVSPVVDEWVSQVRQPPRSKANQPKSQVRTAMVPPTEWRYTRDAPPPSKPIAPKPTASKPSTSWWHPWAIISFVAILFVGGTVVTLSRTTPAPAHMHIHQGITDIDHQPPQDGPPSDRGHRPDHRSQETLA